MSFVNPMRSRLVLLVMMTTLAVSAQADTAIGDYLRISGFGTLGVTRAGNEYLGFHRDLYREATFDGDWDVAADSLLGVQLDVKANDQWSGALQLVGKDRLEDSLNNSVEWAFVAYRPTPEWAVRAGRIGFDAYMLSEYRSVGFAYLWARPPQEFYTPVGFDSFDGADIAWEHNLGTGLMRLKLIAGSTRNDFQFGDQVAEVSLKNIHGGSLSWESDHWQLRLTLLFNDLQDENGYFPGLEALGAAYEQITPLWPEAAYYNELTRVNDPSIDYQTIGFAYNNAPWQIQGELGHIESKVSLFPSANNGYISVGRQFGAKTLYAMLSAVDSDNLREEVAIWPEDPMNPYAPMVIPLQQITQQILNSITLNQHSATLGMRWDLRYDLALKLQWDRSWVDRYGTGLWLLQEVPPDDQVVDTYSINLNFIF